ncbi:MAG: twin-arginine translocase TatA/TatE family subunit [Planctomycetes bacterium]|nr:twin-arginine translocase TatA/TatE family subunit [Planctomycetota bacterium]
MFAFFPSLGFQEMFVLLVIGLLLYGRNLPEAGRTFGRVVGQLRRGFNEFKDQMNRDADVSEIKRTFQSTTDEIKRATAARRAITNPTGALRDLTNEAMSSPLPEARPAPTAPADDNGHGRPRPADEPAD